MTRTLRIVFAFLLTAFAFNFVAHAQSSNLQYQIANLVEDQRLMAEQLRRVVAEMDELRRENSRLRSTLEEYESKFARQSGNYATVPQVNDLLAKTVSALEARDEVLRKEMVGMVGEKLDTFGKSVNKALSSVPAMEKPDPNVRTSFDMSGIPSNGIPYTVQPGESIASIAKKLNSRIDWIQNRNQISDPRLLQVGQVIFVPQQTSQ